MQYLSSPIPARTTTWQAQMSKKLDEYPLEIKDGDPPERGKTSYDTKAYAGALLDIAQRIKPGQFVENLSAGSLGKLKKQRVVISVKK
jgi:hypothetical protein